MSVMMMMMMMMIHWVSEEIDDADSAVGTLYLRLTSTDFDIFGTNVAERACTVICFRISPN